MNSHRRSRETHSANDSRSGATRLRAQLRSLATAVAVTFVGATLTLPPNAQAATPAPDGTAPLTVAPGKSATPAPDTHPTPVARATPTDEGTPGPDGKIHITIPRNAFPVRSDNDGADYDDVIVRRIEGVRWKANGRVVEFAGRDDFARVDTLGAISVTVTVESADPAKYVLDDTPTWTIPFTTGTRVTIEPDQAPVGQDTPGTDDDWLILTKIDGVTWTIDGKDVVFPDETRIMRVPISTPAVQVKAVVAEGYDMTGQAAWNLAYPMAVRPTDALARTTVPLFPRGAEGLAAGRRLTWAPFAGAEGRTTYDVYYRVVSIDRYGKRSVTKWRTWLQDYGRTWAPFNGEPGGIYQVGVRATDSRGVRSEWSDPEAFVVPASASATTGRLRGGARMVADAASVGGDLVNMSRRGASWSTTTRYTDRVDLSFATGPTLGNADVYLDGRKVRTVSTYSATWQRRKHLVTVPTTWGKHTVSVVNRPVGARKTTLLDAYGLGS